MEFVIRARPVDEGQMTSSEYSLAHLLPPYHKKQVAAWLEEDCSHFDYGGYVVGESPVEAFLYGKSAGCLAGCPFFDEVFAQLGCK